MKTLIATTVLCLAPLTLASAQTCSKQSPSHTVALLELYTSEGCSSCPPADHAVSALQKAASADLVVPLALHVDYWDYIGWTDRFAKPGFTQRQRWLADLTGSHAVYTPEMFIAGRELRDWPDALASNIGTINRKLAQASIGIKIGAEAGGKLPVEISTKTTPGAKLYIALYENGLSSSVKAGENNGVVLRHDYVVRDWIGPITLSTDGDSVSSRVLSVPSSSISRQLGVAAFVQNRAGEVLQALALPLCGS
ncbi:MAG TPA: DUF1223 domain-containing protein [Burkholderiaceae bacterium]|jgi:hypothetical protein|nr:DUF1223 domain-containing protein [Burkholderiaceae bacterium]